MNKTELVSAISDRTQLSRKDSESILKAFVDVVSEQLQNGEKVQLVGFGTFETTKREARQGRNPQTGETITVPAANIPKFKAGKGLKEQVNA